MIAVRKSGADARVDPTAAVKRSRLGRGTAVMAGCVVLGSTIGDNCDIEARNLLRSATVGSMTYTGADTSIMWADVGSYCCIARLVDIGGNQHDYHAASMMPTYRLMERLAGKITRHPDEARISVGNDVWIGSGASVLRKSGLHVGDGAVIGAGAVVTASVPPYAIVAGIPARVIGWRFARDIADRLGALCWWDWPPEVVVEHWDLLSGKLNEEVLDQLEGMARERGLL